MEIDILLLELKDYLNKNDLVIDYKNSEKVLLNNSLLLSKIDNYNDLLAEYEKIEYQEYLNKQRIIEKELELISKAIFKDIIHIGEINECCKR
jgi:hypothetical protein